MFPARNILFYGSMHLLFTVDGALFVLIGLIVLIVPSPQPALVRPLDDLAIRPFKDTRRLLASQFIGNGLLALVIGLSATAPSLERAAAAGRVVTIAIVLGVNAAQLAGGAWKRAPLFVITGALSVVTAAYLWFLLR